MNENNQLATCEASLRESVTLHECSNEKHEPIGLYGPLVSKIPVVIAEPVVQIDIESIIDLEEPALEIKRIKKNLFLTQYKLIDTDSPKSGKLFLSGFIRKNIEYATVESVCAENSTVCGNIRHATVNVPFRCVTKVYYENPPITNYTGFTKEIEYFTDKLRGCDACAQKVIGRNPCEQDFINFESFTEKVYCELEEVKFYEEDIHMNPASLGCEFPAEHAFESITEKMVVYLKLKLIQNQQVYVPKPPMKTTCTYYAKKHDWKGKTHKKNKKK